MIPESLITISSCFLALDSVMIRCFKTFGLLEFNLDYFAGLIDLWYRSFPPPYLCIKHNYQRIINLGDKNQDFYLNISFITN